MEIFLVLSMFALAALIILFLSYRDKLKELKEQKKLIEDYAFCADCVQKYNSQSTVLSVLVYGYEMTNSRKHLLFKMGFIATRIREIVHPFMDPMYSIAPDPSKRTQTKRTQTNNIPSHRNPVPPPPQPRIIKEDQIPEKENDPYRERDRQLYTDFAAKNPKAWEPLEKGQIKINDRLHGEGVLMHGRADLPGVIVEKDGNIKPE